MVPGKTAKRKHRFAIALRHAATPHGPDFVENLICRCGPCHLCRRPCFSMRSDGDLARRLLTGRKPVGIFVRRNTDETLGAEMGLTTWTGRNRWGMHIVVASLEPDNVVAGLGAPRKVACIQTFIDERLPMHMNGAFYGYRHAH